MALTANILIGLAALLAALVHIYLAVMLGPALSFVLAGLLFGLGAILLFWETLAILRQSRIGTMPVAISSQRPLGLVSLAVILLAILTVFTGPFVGISAH